MDHGVGTNRARHRVTSLIIDRFMHQVSEESTVLENHFYQKNVDTALDWCIGHGPVVDDLASWHNWNECTNC